MKEIMTVAESTWKGILKMKVVYFLVLCVWILVASMFRYNEISLDRHRELMLDMSLLLNQIAAILVVLSLTFDIPREIREGIAATLLTKSLGRTKYLIGKTFGIYVTGAVICTLIAIGSYFIYNVSFPEEKVLTLYVQIQGLIVLSLIPMAPIAVFCALVFPEMAAPILALLGIWFSTQTSNIKIPILSGGVLPNLNFFNLKEHLIYQVNIPWSYIGLTTLWGIAFATFLLMLSGIIFRFKDVQ